MGTCHFILSWAISLQFTSDKLNFLRLSLSQLHAQLIVASVDRNGFPELSRFPSPELGRCSKSIEKLWWNGMFIKRKILHCRHLLNLFLCLLLLGAVPVLSYGFGNNFLKMKLSGLKHSISHFSIFVTVRCSGLIFLHHNTSEFESQ